MEAESLMGMVSNSTVVKLGRSLRVKVPFPSLANAGKWTWFKDLWNLHELTNKMAVDIPWFGDVYEYVNMIEYVYITYILLLL